MGSRGGMIVELIEPVAGEVDFYTLPSAERRVVRDPLPPPRGLHRERRRGVGADGRDPRRRRSDFHLHRPDPRPRPRRLRRHDTQSSATTSRSASWAKADTDFFSGLASDSAQACRFRRASIVLASTSSTIEEDPMKYMLLIHQGSTPAPPSAEWDAAARREQAGRLRRLQGDQRDAGCHAGRRRMQPPETATTVRVRTAGRSPPTGRSPRSRRRSAATCSMRPTTSTPRSSSPRRSRPRDWAARSRSARW